MIRRTFHQGAQAFGPPANPGRQRPRASAKGGCPVLSTILIILLILLLVGALPRWGYSSGWGYGPGGIVGVLLIVVIVLALTGRL